MMISEGRGIQALSIAINSAIPAYPSAEMVAMMKPARRVMSLSIMVHQGCATSWLFCTQFAAEWGRDLWPQPVIDEWCHQDAVPGEGAESAPLQKFQKSRHGQKRRREGNSEAD